MVIVVIYRKAQAELGHAGQVDIGEGDAVEGHRVPAAGGRVLDRPGGVLAGCCLKVSQLQGIVTAKGALADVHLDIAMGGEGVGTDQSLLPDLERDLGDDGVIRQARCVEGQDGAVLAVAGVVTQVEDRGGAVHGPARAAGLAGFQHPAVLTAGRAIRYGQRRVHDIHRRVVVGGRSVAQLTVPVLSPALDPAARSSRTGVIPTGGDGTDHTRQPAHGYRRGAVGGRAVAQLTIFILSPALDPAARSPRTGVIITGVDGADPARQPAYAYRRQAVGGRSVAQLTEPVVSPALDPTARSPRTGVIITGGDGADPARQPTHIYRRVAVGGRAVAQLTDCIPSPALDPAARVQRTGVTPTGGDGADPARQPAHIYRRGAGGGRAVAQLTVVVQPPALDPARSRHRQDTLFSVHGTSADRTSSGPRRRWADRDRFGNRRLRACDRDGGG